MEMQTRLPDAKQYYDDINKSVQVLMNTDASKYSSQFKEIGDQLNTAQLKLMSSIKLFPVRVKMDSRSILQSVAEEIRS